MILSEGFPFGIEASVFCRELGDIAQLLDVFAGMRQASRHFGLVHVAKHTDNLRKEPVSIDIRM